MNIIGAIEQFFGRNTRKVLVPTKELYSYLDYFDQVAEKHMGWAPTLQNPNKTKLFGDIFAWKRDKNDYVGTIITLYKHQNPDLCSTADYIKPSEKWYKDYHYQETLRDHIKSAIEEANAKSIGNTN